MQLRLRMVTIEDLVPQEHFLRKLEAALDLSFIYRETEKLYSRRYDRKWTSRTDPESGHLNRPGKPKGPTICPIRRWTAITASSWMWQ